MKIVVIGGVVAGTSAAAKARRNDDKAKIVIYEKDDNISYSGCGIPYYIGDKIDDICILTPRDPEYFMSKYRIDVKIKHEVLAIDSKNKKIQVKNLITEEIFNECYDKLVIATGATTYIPNIKGNEKKHVFSLRNIHDGVNIKEFIKNNKPKDIVIAGSGFIGFELLENLSNDDVNVTLIEIMDRITPNLDKEMSTYLQEILKDKDLHIRTSTSISEIKENKVLLENGDTILADMVILATGVRPNTKLAKEAGIILGKYGGIVVNKKMKTNIPDIYACGDCIETYSTVSGKTNYKPLGTTANKTGSITGDVITGGTLEYHGNLGTSIFKLFDLTIANTGLSEQEAVDNGYNVITELIRTRDKTSYFGAEEMMIKAIADKDSKRLLGVQIIGKGGVDKRIDIFVTLITYKAKVDELFHLDLAYSPPFSTAKDPVHYTGMVLTKSINKK
jgi:NADPH-dependent 2,4-dienoyl-CoA reductase/sulfur reductase-like enzyme